MEIEILENLATSEVLFAVLFIGGLIFIGRWFLIYMAEQKKENDERETQLIDIYKAQIDRSSMRENELMTHLSKNTEQLVKIADTLEGVQTNLQRVENRVHEDLQTVWKELGAKADKRELMRKGDE